MGLDWGRALAEGVQAGASGYAKQQMAIDEDARWLEKQKQLQAMNAQEAIEKEKFLLGLKPPETRKVNVTGKEGRPAIQQQEWDVTSRSWKDVGDQTPDINFERLEETSRHNQESEDARQRQLDLTGQLNAARMDAMQARAERAGAAKDAKEVQPRTYTFTGKDGRPIQRVGHFEGSTFVPALDESGNPVQAEKYKETAIEQKDAMARKGQRDAIGPSYPKDPFNDRDRKPVNERGLLSRASDIAPVFVDPSSGDAPRGTLPQVAPSAAPAKPAAAPYREGQIIYNKQGQKFVVRNGVPVPV